MDLIDTSMKRTGDIPRASAHLRDLEDTVWQEIIKTIPTDFYHRPEYLQVASRHEKGAPSIVHSSAAGEAVILPLLFHPVPAALHPGSGPVWLDAASPYGYPCPLTTARAPEAVARHWQAILALLRERDVVTLFVRLHPLLTGDAEVAVLRRFGEVVEHGETVWIDLREESDAAWKGVRENHRRDIARLRKTGWSVAIKEFSREDRFVHLYYKTMARHRAPGFYIFDIKYFDDLCRSVAGGVYLAAAVGPDGETGAQALFLASQKILQYHLGATDERYHRLAPMKLLFDEVRGWAGGRGLEFLHLGGGVGGRPDSLFHFKAGFSDRRAPARTFRCIIDPARYGALVEAWRRRYSGDGAASADFFPPYRAVVNGKEQGSGRLAGMGRAAAPGTTSR